MANLTAQSRFDDVYQIETTDAIQGGTDGIANRQAQQLANRDEYLKDQLSNKANTNHDHDARYSRKVHTHDDRYYTESESDGRFALKTHHHNAIYLKKPVILWSGNASPTVNITLSSSVVNYFLITLHGYHTNLGPSYSYFGTTVHPFALWNRSFIMNGPEMSGGSHTLHMTDITPRNGTKFIVAGTGSVTLTTIFGIK